MHYFYRPIIMNSLSARSTKMGLLCLLILVGISDHAYAAQTPSQEPSSEEGNIAPIRVIGDRYPIFAGVAVDAVNDKVVMTDDNHFSVLLYDRDVPGDSEEITEYRRRIQGPQTRLSSVCGVALDPETQEMYVLNTDFGNNMLVFSYEQSGNASPLRELSVDHGGWGIFLDRQVNNELFFTIQHLNKIAVYRPNAQGNQTTVRFIQGPKTRLADPHGIFVDTENDEIVVTNHHSAHRIEAGVHAATLNFPYMLQSTGRYQLASVTVYSRTAQGDVAPLRTIQGPKTRLNLPLGVAVDADGDGSFDSLKKLEMLAEAVMEKCDANDGINDGVIDNPLSCDFDPEVDLSGMMCAGDVNADGCLTTAQLQTIKDFYSGPYDSRGRSILKGKAFGTELEWANRYIPYEGNSFSPSQFATSGDHINYLFYETDPGVPMPDLTDPSLKPDKTRTPPEWSLWEFDIDDFTAGLGDFMKSITDATDPDLRRFHIRNGGKMILYTGWADPSPPVATLIDYYNDLADTTFSGDLDTTKEHTRLFLVPGMGHCRGGPGPNTWDKLAPLVDWWKTAMHLILSLPPTAPMGWWTTNGGSVPTRSWLCTRAPPGVKTILPIG